MPNDKDVGPPQPLLVSILRQGPYLIASINTSLDDSQLLRFQRDLIDQVGRDRARGDVYHDAAGTVATSLVDEVALETQQLTVVERGVDRRNEVRPLPQDGDEEGLRRSYVLIVRHRPTGSP